MDNETIVLMPAASRAHTKIDWLDGWHSFSFGEHYDPSNVGHGLLIVSNDDTIAPGGGFGTHGHRDMEIVSWMLDGELAHRDSIGNQGVIYPGLAQRMSAGSGIRHSEMNASQTHSAHLIQMWVVPDTNGITPSYEQLDVNDRLVAGGLVVVASGQGHEGAIRIHQRGAVMSVGRLHVGETVALPDAPFVHLFVGHGEIDMEGARMTSGDAARLTNAGVRSITARAASEVIVWESNAAVAR